MGNYSFDGIEERARAALEAHRSEVRRLEMQYEQAKAARKVLGRPAVAILGMGRAGKDEAAEFLAKTFGLSPVKSSSLNALPFVAHMIGMDPEAAYAERHQHREFWVEACNQLRKTDLTTLARWCLGQCDFAVGLRGRDEVPAVVKGGVVDLTIWIERNVPTDPTVEFTSKECDFVVENYWSLEEFHTRLARIGRALYRG
jgi:hypothetical protein